MKRFSAKGTQKMVTALNISNNILKRAFEDDIDVTPMKLQKLLYFVYKKFLQDTGTPLFSERFEPWKYGPVIRSVYNEYADKHSNRIDRFSSDGNGHTYIGNEENQNLKSALDFVWNTYKNYDGIVLSELTHRSGTAWRTAIEQGLVYLDDNDIKMEGFFQ